MEAPPEGPQYIVRTSSRIIFPSDRAGEVSWVLTKETSGWVAGHFSPPVMPLASLSWRVSAMLMKKCCWQVLFIYPLKYSKVSYVKADCGVWGI